ncbi:MAG: VOC family protein [Candidatus Limnocylindria bacterium]
MTVTPVPEGYHTVTPYLLVKGGERLIKFITDAFGGVETERIPGPNGTVSHAEVRIGDSVVMLGEPTQAAPVPGMLYLYLADVDEAYSRALAAGATSIQEPRNEFYGDRVAAVRDMSGNQWYIATHVEDVSLEELRRRATQRG